jgi:hypothetical protein
MVRTTEDRCRVQDRSSVYFLFIGVAFTLTTNCIVYFNTYTVAFPAIICFMMLSRSYHKIFSVSYETNQQRVDGIRELENLALMSLYYDDYL